MKQIFTVLMLLILVIMFAACGMQESEIQYKGELYPVSVVEEIIADELEVENPELDLEITIYEESEDE